ncbi:MAG: FAD-dependent oxidoreductase [Eubacteriaceae bacterium]
MKITVIGAGPGGYEAAIMAAKLGAEVTIVEKDAPGGTCLNRGCIPTKTLLASAEILKNIEEAKDFGINVEGEVTPNFDGMIQRKNKIVSGLVKGVNYLFSANKVTLVKGIGTLVDSNRVKVVKENGEIEIIFSDKIILATGSLPVIPEMYPYDGKKVLQNDKLLLK